jgi:hypothetical protein
MMNTYLKALIGGILIAYGVGKLIIGGTAIFLPAEQRSQLPKFMRFFIADDATIAGKGFDIALMVFGVYTIIHGTDLIGRLPKPWADAILTRYNLYALHAIIGMYLLVFYSLVLFTNFPIPKKPDHTDRYLIEGMLSACLFLIMIPILYAIHTINDNGFSAALYQQWYMMLLCLLSICALLAIMVMILLYIKRKRNVHQASHTRLSDFTTLVMIPLSSVT